MSDEHEKLERRVGQLQKRLDRLVAQLTGALDMPGLGAVDDLEQRTAAAGEHQAVCLQTRESCQSAESVEVRRTPQRSSDVFQRCSNRGHPG
jgi:hypothetical protein